MEDLRERAAQRLIEPGAIVEYVRDTVIAFEDPGLSLADGERLARMVRERCDYADEVRLSKSPRLWDWAGDHIPPAAVDADLLDDYAHEYREALATGDLTAGLQSVPDYADTLGLPDLSPLTRRMMARVILREMAASCERTAKRYREEVVPYLDRSEPNDIEDTLDLLDGLNAESAGSPDMLLPSDQKIAEWTSCRPIPLEHDADTALAEFVNPPTDPVDLDQHPDSVTVDTARPSVAPSYEVGEEVDGRAGAPPRQDGLDPSSTMPMVWDQFAADMASTLGTWNEDNARHSKAIARLWERVHPGLPIQDIRSHHAAELQRIALSLPSLHAKARVWTCRPIREVVALFAQLPRNVDKDAEIDGIIELVETLQAENAGRPIDRAILSLAAWNRQAAWLRTFGKWLKKNSLHEEGLEIFGNLHVEADEDAEELRRGVRSGRPHWERAEAEALFATPLFLGSRSMSRRHKPGSLVEGDALYWLVAIAATTGMRREEIAQCRVQNVKRLGEDGRDALWYFDLDRTLSLKNRESERWVPVPQALIDLGFWDDLITGRDAEAMLLPGVVRNAAGKFGDVTGKGFGRYRRALPAQTVEVDGGEKEVDFGAPLLDLHAMRHSMATWLIDADVGQPIAEELLGHRSEARRTAFLGYDHGRKLVRLKEAIDSVEAPFDPKVLRKLRQGAKRRVRVKARRA